LTLTLVVALFATTRSHTFSSMALRLAHLRLPEGPRDVTPRCSKVGLIIDDG
jgi:hypothetical protein